MWELVVIWWNGDRDVYEYANRVSAEKAERGMKMALGVNIGWSCVRPKASQKSKRNA